MTATKHHFHRVKQGFFNNRCYSQKTIQNNTRKNRCGNLAALRKLLRTFEAVLLRGGIRQ
jgi:hypothetical protein